MPQIYFTLTLFLHEFVVHVEYLNSPSYHLYLDKCLPSFGCWKKNRAESWLGGIEVNGEKEQTGFRVDKKIAEGRVEIVMEGREDALGGSRAVLEAHKNQTRNAMNKVKYFFNNLLAFLMY